MADNNISLTGLVVKEAKYGEGNKILTILTDTKGKIQASANGVRSYKSKISAGSGMYCYSKFLLKVGRGMYNITAADTVCDFYGLRNDYAKLAYAAYFSELVCSVTVEDDACEVLRLLLNTLYYLETKDALAFIKPVFELRLMKECGFMPNVFACTMCGSEHNIVSFNENDGVCYCSKCADRNNVTPAVIDAMKYILTVDLKKIFSFNVNDETFARLYEICESYALSQVGSVPKSLIYLKNNV